jgi:hypothetical protein
MVQWLMDEAFWRSELKQAMNLERAAFSAFLIDRGWLALTHWEDANLVTLAASRQLWSIHGCDCDSPCAAPKHLQARNDTPSRSSNTWIMPPLSSAP